MATDVVPLIDAQTAAILASVNNYSIQQHVRVCDNCIEAPNTYTIYNLETNQAIIRVEEESDGCTRCFCAPAHSLILRFHALDPAGNPLFPVITMEREGCCTKPCIQGLVWHDCCANESFVHAGIPAATPETNKAGKLPKDHVIGRNKVPVPFAGFTNPTIQIMDRTPNSDVHWADAVGPQCFGGCSELCCNVPFMVKRIEPNGDPKVKIGDVAKINKLKPKSLSAAARELLTDSDIYQLEILDYSVTPQQRATLLGTALMMDYAFFERDIDMCGFDSDGKFFINLCNCFCCGVLTPCQVKCKPGA